MLIDICIDAIFFPKGRLKLRQYELGVYQYLPSSFYKNTRITENIFTLDIVDLAYSTARTLCSYHLTEKELYFDVIASMLSHLNFIYSPNSNFLLSESRYKRLRDFSKSTRIGEMAQGINYLFVAKRLNFPYIIDFDLAKEKTQGTLNIQTNGKTPDFVVLDSSMTRIGLFESKGTMSGVVSGTSGYLSKGLKQINDVHHPCFDYAIPICTKFEHNNDIDPAPIPIDRKSSINYALIETECTDDYKDTSLLKKIHYASWFYLVGDFDRVESILREGVIAPFQEDNDPIYALDAVTDKNNPIYWVKIPLNLSVISDKNDIGLHLFMTSRYLHRGKFKIGIYKSVIDTITNSNNSEETFILPEGEINYLKKYPDGTLLYIKNDE